jgi:hypothetical protein
VREREDANRTREAGNRDEIQGVAPSWLNLYRNGAAGFIDWLDVMGSRGEHLSSDRNWSETKVLWQVPEKQRKFTL